MHYIDVISDYRLMFSIYEISLYDSLWTETFYFLLLF